MCLQIRCRRETFAELLVALSRCFHHSPIFIFCCGSFQALSEKERERERWDELTFKKIYKTSQFCIKKSDRLKQSFKISEIILVKDIRDCNILLFMGYFVLILLNK